MIHSYILSKDGSDKCDKLKRSWATEIRDNKIKLVDVATVEGLEYLAFYGVDIQSPVPIVIVDNGITVHTESGYIKGNKLLKMYLKETQNE